MMSLRRNKQRDKECNAKTYKQVQGRDVSYP